MVLDLLELIEIIGITSGITTGSTTGIMLLLKTGVQSELCKQMSNNFAHFENRMEDLFIRVGILERTRQ